MTKPSVELNLGNVRALNVVSGPSFTPLSSSKMNSEVKNNRLTAFKTNKKAVFSTIYTFTCKQNYLICIFADFICSVAFFNFFYLDNYLT